MFLRGSVCAFFVFSCLTLARKFEQEPPASVPQTAELSFFHDNNNDFRFGFPEGDLIPAPSKQHAHNAGGVSFSVKSGKEHEDAHRSAEGEKGSKGYTSKENHDTSKHEKYGKDLKSSEQGEKGGKEKTHEDEAGFYKKYNERDEGHKSAKFGEKKGHKKGHKTKGYHNKFHKDEFHKEHKFYDDYHKSGFHEKDGHQQSYHASKEGAKKKGGNHNSAHHKNSHGLKGYKENGKIDDEHKGFKGKKGHQSFYKHFEDRGKKGGATGGRQHGFVRGKHR